MEYNETALSILKDEPGLRDFVHHVTDLSGHNWPSRKLIHNLPINGILVVKLCNEGWGEDPRFYNEAPDFPDEREIIPRSELPRCRNLMLGTQLGLDFLPPDPLSHFLMHLSRTSMSSVVLYHLMTHGGDRETEYAYAFTPQQYVYLPAEGRTEVTCVYKRGESISERKEDLLVAALRHLRMVLSSGYFALHTREFPWERFRI